MKFIPLKAALGHLLVGNFDPSRVEMGVQLTFHPQAGLRRGGRDQLDHHFVTRQRLARRGPAGYGRLPDARASPC